MTEPATRALLRELPSVDELLARPAVRELAGRIGREAARAAARRAVAETRAALLAGAAADGRADGETELVSDRAVLEAARATLEGELRPVLNATGVVLHTNLGRAPLHPLAVAHVAAVASGYSNLEIDLASGARGSRTGPIETLLRELTGAEAGHVVNNCAGATLLALGALGRGGAAVVSRSELVEIGGGFRVPDILEQSGCRLVEVGTTNRTRLSDYAAALDRLRAEQCPRVLLLRVHRSNFALVGFVAEPRLEELAQLAAERGLPLLHDLGSGALDLPAQLRGEATIRDSVRAGSTLVLCSGDKLLGGPQAGLIAGKRAAVEACSKHPLARALRADRMILAALETTLQLHLHGRASELPALASMGADASALSQRATRLALALQERGILVHVVESEGRVGGGSLPLARLQGHAVAIAHQPAEELAARLRIGSPAVLGRVQDGQVHLDVRCLPEGSLAAVAAAVERAARQATRQPPPPSHPGGRSRPRAAEQGGTSPEGLQHAGPGVTLEEGPEDGREE